MSSKRTVKKASSTSATGTKTKASSSPKTPNTTKTTKKKTSKQLSPRKSELDPSVDQDYEGLMSAEHQHELDVSFEAAPQPKKAHTISLSLLARRCIPDSKRDLKPDQIIEKLNDVTHVRLDRECLQNIDGLELLGSSVRNLYLQHNDIQEIEGLETLTSLRFLTLSNNNIQAVQNIHDTKIGFLDLSNNNIQHLDAEQLPKSVIILSLEGNPCQKQDDYRESILKHCVNLSQLDQEPLTLDERRSAGHEVVSESEESEDDEDLIEQGATAYNYDKPFDAQIIGVFDDLSSDMFVRCQARIQNVYDQHKSRLMNLDRIKTEGGITLDSNPTSRMSSRLDSPDITDNSRPATGNNATTGRPNEQDHDTLSTDLSYRLAQTRLSNGAQLICDNPDNMEEEEFGILSPSLVQTSISDSQDHNIDVTSDLSRQDSSLYSSSMYEPTRPVQSPGIPKLSSKQRTQRH